jgi:hypothetical protein
MNALTLTTTQIAIFIAVAVMSVAAVVIWFSIRKRRTKRLRTQFGGDEYTRTLNEGGSRRQAEDVLDKRSERVKGFHIQPLGPGDRARFVESWRSVQTRFVDGPGAAVTEADRLLRDVMSTRGYPASEFEQSAADISVDHPLVLEHYRSAHEIAVRHTQGNANTEDLRHAMIHYRTLFEELVSEPEISLAKAAS